jgi:hypothetical protein
MDVLDFDMRSVVARCSTVTGVRRRAACCEERWERRGRGLGWAGMGRRRRGGGEEEEGGEEEVGGGGGGGDGGEEEEEAEA